MIMMSVRKIENERFGFCDDFLRRIIWKRLKRVILDLIHEDSRFIFEALVRGRLIFVPLILERGIL